MNKALFLVLLLVLSFPALAVHVSDNNEGQVLLFPYYVVREGNDTLISVVNHTIDIKALKVRLREGENGRALLSLNVYLSAFDTWTASISERDGVAVLHSDDVSCTVPVANQLPITLAALSSSPDSGRTSQDRALEGYIEVIEMGTVNRDGLGQLTEYIPSEPPVVRCPELVDAWTSEQGAWQQDIQTDMLPPSGGLSGDAVIINVPAARATAVQATALNDFYHPDETVLPSLNSEPADLDFPNLNNAYPAVSHLYIGHTETLEVIRDEWETGVDAVSASLMKYQLNSEFLRDTRGSLLTDFVFTMPTKHLLSQTSASLSAPFTSSFDEPEMGVGDGRACEGFDNFFVNEHGRRAREPLSSPPTAGFHLCYAVSVMSFGGETTSSRGAAFNEANGITSSILSSRLFAPSGFNDFLQGWVEMNLDTGTNPHTMHTLTNPNSGRVYRGLPVIGFTSRGADNQLLESFFGAGFQYQYIPVVESP